MRAWNFDQGLAKMILPKVWQYLQTNPALIFSDAWMMERLQKNPISLIEGIFEKIRHAEFASKPCRWRSSHLCRSQSDAEAFSLRYAYHLRRPYIYRIETSESQFHLGDQQYLEITTLDIKGLSDLEGRARLYWAGNISGQSLIEVLCPPENTKVAELVKTLP